MLYDEPLVRLNDAEHNLLSVSPDVNTKVYHDAFMDMPVPKPVAEAAYIQAGRILQKADGKDEEYLVAIDARTGALVADNLGRAGYSGSTTFTARERTALRLHARDIVTIHNHPHSGGPSFRDIMTASRNGMVVGSIVVAHDGAVWYMSALSDRIAARLEDQYNHSKDSPGDKAEIYAINRLIE